MSTIIVLRSGLTVEEVSAALRNKLGPSYQVIPSVTSKGFVKEVSDETNTILVKGKWFQRVNIRILPRSNNTEIQVSPGATYPGLIRLIDRLGAARRVHQVLENSPELAGPN